MQQLRRKGTQPEVRIGVSIQTHTDTHGGFECHQRKRKAWSKRRSPLGTTKATTSHPIFLPAFPSEFFSVWCQNSSRHHYKVQSTKFWFTAAFFPPTKICHTNSTMSEYHAYTVRVIGVATHEDESGPYTVRFIARSQSLAILASSVSSRTRRLRKGVNTPLAKSSTGHTRLKTGYTLESPVSN